MRKKYIVIYAIGALGTMVAFQNCGQPGALSKEFAGALVEDPNNSLTSNPDDSGALIVNPDPIMADPITQTPSEMTQQPPIQTVSTVEIPQVQNQPVQESLPQMQPQIPQLTQTEQPVQQTQLPPPPQNIQIDPPIVLDHPQVPSQSDIPTTPAAPASAPSPVPNSSPAVIANNSVESHHHESAEHVRDGKKCDGKHDKEHNENEKEDDDHKDQHLLKCPLLQISDVLLKIKELRNMNQDSGKGEIQILTQDAAITGEKVSLRIKVPQKMSISSLRVKLDDRGNRILDSMKKVYELNVDNSGSHSGLLVKLDQSVTLSSDTEYILEFQLKMMNQKVKSKSCKYLPVVHKARIFSVK